MEIKCRSKVLDLAAVEDFTFKFADLEFPLQDKQGKTSTTRKLEDIEGILIHANWAEFDLQVEANLEMEDKKEVDVGNKDRVGLRKFNLRIPDDVMKDGILFIWVEKEFTNDVIVYFEAQGFVYVENLCYVMLDRAQKESTLLRKTTDATSAIARKPYKFLTKSHRTLLMLRRVKYDTCSLDQKSFSGATPTDSKNHLELRH